MSLKSILLNLTFGLLLLIISEFEINAQTLWTGPMTTFTKPDSVDWTLPEHQDCITANVCITRANNQGIFNIVLETGYDNIDRTSPADTEWANGTIADGIENLTFTSWFDSIIDSPIDDIGVNKVVHLITDDIYIDLVFTAWTGGGGGSGTGFGGGFSYMRSTSSCPTDINLDGMTNSSDFLQLLGQYNQPCDAYCPTDVNGDGATNSSDFLQLLGQYGEQCN